MIQVICNLSSDVLALNAAKDAFLSEINGLKNDVAGRITALSTGTIMDKLNAVAPLIPDTLRNGLLKLKTDLEDLTGDVEGTAVALAAFAEKWDGVENLGDLMDAVTATSDFCNSGIPNIEKIGSVLVQRPKDSTVPTGKPSLPVTLDVTTITGLVTFNPAIRYR